MKIYSFITNEIFWAALIGLAIISIQFYYFINTNKKIRRLKTIFPDYSFGKKQLRQSTDEEEEVSITQSYDLSRILTGIIDDLNGYLKTNKGTADFEVLKTIVDKDIELLYEELSTSINIPLYVGLMGTFIGIIMGLIGILLKKTIDEQSIMSFIAGILIAMGASLMGLFLTVRSNASNFKKARTACDKGRNSFFNFLRTDVLAQSSKGLNDVIFAFKENINKFNRSFGSNINLFDEKLSSNINSLALSVSRISDNIGLVNANTASNLEIIRSLQADKFQQMISANANLVETVHKTIPSFTEFFEKQKELNNAVDKTLLLTTTVETIMNRVKRFEASINALGDRIDNAAYMGADLLQKVNRKLEELDNQFTLLKQHSQTTSGQIEVHFDAEKKKIEVLSLKVLNELQGALQFNVGNNPFKKLEFLESIDKSLRETQTKLHAIRELQEERLAHFSRNGNGLAARKRKKSILRRIFPFIKSNREQE